MKKAIVIILLCLLLGCAGKSKNTSTVHSEDKPVAQNKRIEPIHVSEAWFEIDENGGITKYIGPRNIPLVIPPSINGVKVTSITDPTPVLGVFRDKGLTSLTIPEGVTYIGRSAFFDNQLAYVIIPDTVTVISNNAFGRNQLSSVIIPEGVSYIGTAAFSNNQLAAVVLSSNLAEIDSWAFNTNQLTAVVIPGSVRKISARAFSDNPITSITIGADV
ncbi:MAG: leucine-rich repeat domain-containing protein [Treponema sp.]|jgi:hypothetical protein|nr:leucine-rich repeat domain-containing protein [Treponema sp.]